MFQQETASCSSLPLWLWPCKTQFPKSADEASQCPGNQKPLSHTLPCARTWALWNMGGKIVSSNWCKAASTVSLYDQLCSQGWTWRGLPCIVENPPQTESPLIYQMWPPLGEWQWNMVWETCSLYKRNRASPRTLEHLLVCLSLSQHASPFVNPFRVNSFTFRGYHVGRGGLCWAVWCLWRHISPTRKTKWHLTYCCLETLGKVDTASAQHQ